MEPHRQLCKDLDEAIAFVHEVEQRLRAQLNFGIDGVVVKVNSFALQRELGVKGMPALDVRTGDVRWRRPLDVVAPVPALSVPALPLA